MVKVTGGDVNMHKMTVVYVGGEMDEIAMKHSFKKKEVPQELSISMGATA